MDAEGGEVGGRRLDGLVGVGVVVGVEGAEVELIALLDVRADVLEADEAGVVVLGEIGELRQLALKTDVEASLGVGNRPRRLVLDGADLPEPVEGGVADVLLAREEK